MFTFFYWCYDTDTQIGMWLMHKTVYLGSKEFLALVHKTPYHSLCTFIRHERTPFKGFSGPKSWNSRGNNFSLYAGCISTCHRMTDGHVRMDFNVQHNSIMLPVSLSWRLFLITTQSTQTGTVTRFLKRLTVTVCVDFVVLRDLKSRSIGLFDVPLVSLGRINRGTPSVWCAVTSSVLATYPVNCTVLYKYLPVHSRSKTRNCVIYVHCNWNATNGVWVVHAKYIGLYRKLN
jgi:hypothetical protein